MARKKCKYVVGEDADYGFVVGHGPNPPYYYAQPTTFKGAIRISKKLLYKATIYELVPVDEDGRRLT